jgi:hypothetical protein
MIFSGSSVGINPGKSSFFNILTLNRYAATAVTLIDRLNYLYPLNSNQLSSVSDDIARWTSVDKKAEDETQIDLSPYAYVANDPINKDDPDGNCPECVGAAVGAVLDIAFQSIDIALDDHKTFSKDFSFTSVGSAAVAGTTHVGVAAWVIKFVEVAGLGTKLLGTVIKRAVDGGVSATSNAIQQKAVSGKIDGVKVAVDGVAGIIGGHLGDKAEASALKSAEGKVLKYQEGRASRMAVGGRAWRVVAAAAAQKKIANFTGTRAAATAVGASGVVGNTVKKVQDKSHQ